MKIKISEFETYNIDFPNECDAQQLAGIIDRLLAVQKILNKTGIGDVGVRQKKETVFHGRPQQDRSIIMSDKNIIIDMIRIFYSFDIKGKEAKVKAVNEYLRSKGIDYEAGNYARIYSTIKDGMKKHNITREDARNNNL